MSATTDTITDTITVTGIADCHGIESMIEKEEAKESMFFLSIRANSNRQRHAVLYEADLNQCGFDAVTAHIDNLDFKLALEALKVLAIEVRTDPHHAKSWGMIPNSDLDPWS